jgi:hypothetical protein
VLSSKLDHIYYTLLCIYICTVLSSKLDQIYYTLLCIYMHSAEQQVRSYLLHTFMHIYICTLLSSKLDHIYYTLLCIYMHSAAVAPFTSPWQQSMQLCGSQNQFPELNQHKLDFLHLILVCRIT